MAIKNINYSVRLYKLVPATVLQAYQHRIAQTLFGLPKAETKYGQLQVNADGTWRFENLLAKGSNTFNPNNAQTKEKALEFATNWLSQVRSKISEALEKQIFPTDLQNLIPHNYLRLESATPQYKENSQYITHWDIRYDLEYPYYPNLKARGDQQYFTIQVSDRIIGVEAQCRATNGVEGSTLITPAPLQDMEAILQAQIQVENTDDNELSAPQALPLLYRTVGNRLLPYWITQLGDLVPATREGEMVQIAEDAPITALPQTSAAFISTPRGLCFRNRGIREGDNYIIRSVLFFVFDADVVFVSPEEQQMAQFNYIRNFMISVNDVWGNQTIIGTNSIGSPVILDLTCVLWDVSTGTTTFVCSTNSSISTAPSYNSGERTHTLMIVGNGISDPNTGAPRFDNTNTSYVIQGQFPRIARTNLGIQGAVNEWGYMYYDIVAFSITSLVNQNNIPMVFYAAHEFGHLLGLSDRYLEGVQHIETPRTDFGQTFPNIPFPEITTILDILSGRITFPMYLSPNIRLLGGQKKTVPKNV